ncbi:TIGR04086 family membrane protein [Paenibacillus protaetiae]|uniref:TIGR04086 family membrane protein n=1 Tax=Paenibacillus protaetiae TaxID=2509456 RepID=A0A4P6ET36_9BACL|nr:TIGR04086 family membrane protein [Paenibacillus protaetiae]QAY65183.1 TIGR04086 family membrane protein [Paenibacillus protaetiae]
MSSSVNNEQAPRMGSPFIKGLLYATIWLAVGALLLSSFLHYGNMKESSLPLYTMIVHGFCSFAGGFVSGKRSGRKGWYYGGLLGIVYAIIILIISFLAADAELSARSLTLLGIAFAAGAFGGMLGVNLR